MHIYHTYISSWQELANSLDQAVRQDDPYFNKLIRILATRCMTQAIYFNSGTILEHMFAVEMVM